MSRKQLPSLQGPVYPVCHSAFAFLSASSRTSFWKVFRIASNRLLLQNFTQAGTLSQILREPTQTMTKKGKPMIAICKTPHDHAWTSQQQPEVLTISSARHLLQSLQIHRKTKVGAAFLLDSLSLSLSLGSTFLSAGLCTSAEFTLTTLSFLFAGRGGHTLTEASDGIVGGALVAS